MNFLSLLSPLDTMDILSSLSCSLFIFRSFSLLSLFLSHTSRVMVVYPDGGSSAIFSRTNPFWLITRFDLCASHWARHSSGLAEYFQRAVRGDDARYISRREKIQCTEHRLSRGCVTRARLSLWK